MPLLAAGVVTVYLRVWEPVPHVFVHVEYEPQEPTQSTGHPPVLHDAVSTSPLAYWHGVPPLSAGCEMEYVRFFVPPPHVFVHVEYAPKAPTQFTGQPFVLHDTVSTVPSAVGQFVPLKSAGCETVYSRLRVPPPHDAVQVVVKDHAPTQLMGQLSVLHETVSTVPWLAGHAAPAPACG